MMSVIMTMPYITQCVVVCAGPSNATRTGSQELESEGTRAYVSLQDFREVYSTYSLLCLLRLLIS